MQDLIYLAVIAGFFVIAALFVHACDLLIGSDDDALGEGAGLGADDEEDIDIRDLVKEVRR